MTRPLATATRVARLTREQFAVLLLAIVAAAAWLGASGLRTLADMRGRHFVSRAKNEAASPIPYGAALPSLGRSVGAWGDTGGGLMMIVRVDSVPEAQGKSLCALAREMAAPGGRKFGVRWMTLGGEVHPCIRDAVGGVVVRGDEKARAEMSGARWVAAGPGMRALYSRREVPILADEVREVASLLAPAAGPASTLTLSDEGAP